MFAEIPITPWHWIGFVVAVLLFLALDLGFFHRQAHVVRFREALLWTVFWFLCALTFAATLAPAFVPGWGKEQQAEFITGYILELSLSMDNVFVMALIFSYFRIPQQLQHRVLFWGILGALIMRGLMIVVGASLVARYHWVLYLFGLFLMYTAYKMLSTRDSPEVYTGEAFVITQLRRVFPITGQFDGPHFVTMLDGVRVLTPLAVALVLVETMDLVFALDSIPAIFAITADPFLVFTSNVFAILGLRSLYFVLAGVIEKFRYLKVSLAAILGLIGLKMMLADVLHEWIGPNFNLYLLCVVVLILVVGALASVHADRRARTIPE